MPGRQCGWHCVWERTVLVPGDCNAINFVVCLACQGSTHCRLVRCTAANCPHTVYDVSGLEHTRAPHVTLVITFSQARCVRCETARAVGW